MREGLALLVLEAVAAALGVPDPVLLSEKRCDGEEVSVGVWLLVAVGLGEELGVCADEPEPLWDWLGVDRYVGVIDCVVL